MAKESMKARERKRERLVAKYAAKRAALKEAGDWEGLQKFLADQLLTLNTENRVRRRVHPGYDHAVTLLKGVHDHAEWR